ncbi:hypothetical protein BJ973_003998 [Actinoplanes tereljensis]|uniref:Phospholipase D-like domain-containing protein n=1 Tax=Paractinoplanes tereljensis TaxID=571912 RepID=A0A919NXF7_9ACTN|nr:hypothetical protein [Actinoplanes tereljensis]GIF25721.1 hypothetical protein Ate02nite_84510 [Actinoplanes tereljensis]
MTEDLVGAPPPRVLHDMPITDPEEILVLTYTSDLPFVEDVCVRQARARGARVTIVYDADRVEPGFSSGAGPVTDYVPVPVVCRSGGAFHPKLVVIASPTDAMISIGSGNATAQGWHHSAEVWTHLRIDGPTVPVIVEDLAAWLRRLPDHLWITPLGRERLHRVADLLTTRPTRPEPDEPLLLTNDRQPILDQIPGPDGPVDWLGIASPFFDPPADALAMMLTKIMPNAVDILLTRDAQADPSRLQSVLDRVGTVRITQPTTSRYHHGKVFEWWSGPSGTLVTGSANCTRAALLRSMADERGNCELALLQQVTESVLDAVEVVEADLDELPLRVPDRPAQAVPAVRVLAAHVLTEPDRIEIAVLVATGPVPDHLIIDIAGTAVNAVHVGTDGLIHTYRLAHEPGDLARTITVRADDGGLLGTALVIDVHSALSRARHPSPLEQYSFPELLGDEEQMQALLESLHRLAEVLPPRADDDESSVARQRRRTRVEEDIRRAVGSAMLDLALARSRTPAPPGGDSGGELQGDDAPETGDKQQPAGEQGGPPLSAAAAIQAQNERQRAYARQWFQRLVEQSAQWSLAAQLASFRSLLMAVGGGLWTHPQDWTWLVYDGLTSLWYAEEEDTLAHEHAALSAVGLIALRHGVLAGETDSELAANFDERLAEFREYGEWILGAPNEAYESYARELSGYTLGPRFTAANIRSDMAWLLDRNELDDALDALYDIPGTVERATDGAVVVRTTKDAKRMAISVLDRLSDFPNTHVAVYAQTEVHGWWDRRQRRLILAEPVPAGWRATVWRNLMAGIAGLGSNRALPPPSETTIVANPAEAWAKMGKH